MRIPIPFIVFLLSVLSSAVVQARELKIIFSSYTPPYVFQAETTDKPGILVEIFQQAFAGTDYTVKPVFLPLGRGFKLLEEKRVDALSISTTNLGLKAYYSDYCIEYHNYAIGLVSRPHSIKHIADLKGLSIIAFQKADTYLGKEFNETVTGNPNYVEMANQENQVHMLLKGRIDIAVMDRSIFQYYRNKLINEGMVHKDAEYQLYDLFNPSRYRAAFADEKVRDRFNEGLKRLHASGAYQAIYSKYIHDFFVYRE